MGSAISRCFFLFFSLSAESRSLIGLLGCLVFFKSPEIIYSAFSLCGNADLWLAGSVIMLLSLRTRSKVPSVSRPAEKSNHFLASWLHYWHLQRQFVTVTLDKNDCFLHVYIFTSHQVLFTCCRLARPYVRNLNSMIGQLGVLSQTVVPYLTPPWN